MKTVITPLEPELKGILWACLEYWKREPTPAEERIICFSWVEGIYRRRFGSTFHQARLGRLASLGYLLPAHGVRAGHRRYYKIADPHAVEELVRAST